MENKLSILRWIFAGLFLSLTSIIAWALMPGEDGAVDDNSEPTSIEVKIDGKADDILKQMSKSLSSLEKFSFSAQGYYEVVVDSIVKKIQLTNSGKISVQRPDKFKAERTGEIADIGMFFNKGNFTLYGKKLNMYATASAGNNIDNAIDYLQDHLDIYLPASDLLYSDAYAALMEDVTSGVYVGQSMAGGVMCDHLAFSGKDVDWQIWIESGSDRLPRRYVITSKNEEASPEYAIEITEWDTKPKFKDKIFDFNPPAGAQKIDFLFNKDEQTKNSKKDEDK